MKAGAILVHSNDKGFFKDVIKRPKILRPQLLALILRTIFYERTSSIFQQLDTFINYVKQQWKVIAA